MDIIKKELFVRQRIYYTGIVLFVIWALVFSFSSFRSSQHTHDSHIKESLRNYKSSAESSLILRYLLSLDDDPTFRIKDACAPILYSKISRFYYNLYTINIFRSLFFLGSNLIFPGLAEHLIVRNKLSDSLLQNYTSNKEIKQVLILGAGFDTKSIRYASLLQKHGVQVFEVDHPATQARKLQLLSSEPFLMSGQALTKFIKSDLSSPTDRSRLPSFLHEQGYNESLPTIVFCEGLFMYFHPQVVKALFSVLDKLLQKSGGLVYFDTFSERFLNRAEEKSVAWRVAVNHYFSGEPLQFGVDPERLHKFVGKFGFCVRKVFSSDEVERLFLKRKGSLFGRYPSYTKLSLVERPKLGSACSDVGDHKLI